MGKRKCYGRGRAEELPEGAAAGLRVRALGHSSRVSGSVMEGGERKRYRRGRRQAWGGERQTTTLGGAESQRKGREEAWPEEA